MSAGLALPHDGIVHADLALLAPKVRVAVERALAECDAAGLEAQVYETYRTNELQQRYYARGRTVQPPARPVTNASDNLRSWHGYGLAVDVIHRQLEWDAPRSWFADVAAVFLRHTMAWGGRWHSADLPHFQWQPCRTSPSDRARELVRQGGLPLVWQEVGAL